MSSRFDPLITARGFAMGAADVVPGVSGGTMALILGIYQRLLEAISAFDTGLVRTLARRQWREAMRQTDLVFLLQLGAGIALALFFFTRVVPLPRLIVEHPEPVYGLFFGLIIASIIILLGDLGRLGWRGLLGLATGAGLGLLIVTGVPTDTPTAGWFIFLSGALAITAMLLPGISGSFILLLLHKYAYVFDAIGRLDLAVLVPFALGALTGILVFSHMLVWLLHHFQRLTMLTITGILIGSLWLIWPFQDRVYEVVRHKQRLVQTSPGLPVDWDTGTWLAIGLAVIGTVLVLILHRLANGSDRQAS